MDVFVQLCLDAVETQAPQAQRPRCRKRITWQYRQLDHDMRGVVLYIADRAYIVLNTECNAILRVGAACKLYCAAYLCLHGILKIRKLPITLP